MKRILFAAAGTAGHLEPALAVARWIRANNPDISCEFLSSSQGVEERLLLNENFIVHTVTKAALPRRLSPQAVKWPFAFAKSLIEVRNALKGADLLIGFGGYICAPAYLVARSKQIPFYLHEANVLPGWANRLGVRLGGEALLGFDATKRVDSLFAEAQTVGLPLREQIYSASELSPLKANAMREKWLSDCGLDPAKKTILIFGGSLGARSINGVIDEVKNELTRANFQIIHAVGGKNELPERAAGYLPVPYIEDMATAMVSADLLISRAGAVTCAEIITLNKYALLIPLEIGNGEQKYNATEVESLGLATVIANSAFSAHYLSANIIRLMKSAESSGIIDTSSSRHPHAVEAIGYEILSALKVQK